MKTFRFFLFASAIMMWASCGSKENRTAGESGSPEIDAPGVGMAPDSANQKLDSTLKANDTTTLNP